MNSNGIALRVIFGVICFFLSTFIIETALNYGGIWQSQAHPIQNVQITINNITHTGVLSTAWNGMSVLTASDGSVLRFKMFDSVELKLGEAGEGILFAWRFILPPILAIFILLGFIFHWIHREPKKRNSK